MSSNIRVKRICEQCGKARQRAAKVGASNQQTKDIIERTLSYIRAKDHLNIADSSKLLGVSQWTIWWAIGSGNPNAVKMGRRTIIRRSD